MTEGERERPVKLADRGDATSIAGACGPAEPLLIQVRASARDGQLSAVRRKSLNEAAIKAHHRMTTLAF
jgi:hypothetical protein